jgi:hypothetical protein
MARQPVTFESLINAQKANDDAQPPPDNLHVPDNSRPAPDDAHGEE